jgi:hypothetical protein
VAVTASPTSPAPALPGPNPRLPTALLWLLPLALVLLYVLLVTTFFHHEARWTGDRLVGATILLLGFTVAFSLAWFGIAWLASVVLGEYATLGVLMLIARIPGINRHVVLTPPTRPDTPKEVWGRFGILLLIAIGFEVIFMITIVERGHLSPNLVLTHPLDFFVDEFLAGVLLALLLAPIGAFFASRFRTRITDSLEFPLLWLALLLLVVGGTSVLELEVLPGAIGDPALFFTSILFYAPAAWSVCLAFVYSESRVQAAFLRRAWAARSARLHFGRIEIRDDPEGVRTQL